MNSGVGPTPQHQPQSEAAKSALAVTRTLFRTFLLTVLGAIFVYVLGVTFVWLSAVLTVIAGVLGVVVLVRAIRFKQPRIVLFGTISGLVVTAIMCLLVVTAVVFFQQIRTLQDCARGALTIHAQDSCQVDFQNSIPTGLR
ncbi:hypothetical protein [Arthrobacter bambusae]|uniref:hypothetical protein n=1 Tax=Arthrobacter bambusae TaxID=1338426 RepID=UPI002787C894|nr:hypothetical protein [Arthrobacter bambusae]MDQ0029718.1 O-antigen ligase [Arthrobacter bambusae]MDQ0097379.1 O-antigen ligase [Arthrobacter bambusae]